LGWNTYQDGLAEKLLAFVRAGGHAFISYCHLNTTDRPDKPFVYAQDEVFEKLFGCTFGEILDSQGEIVFNNGEKLTIQKQNIVKCTNIQANVIAKDENGNAIVLEHCVGKGKVYLSAVAEYSQDDGVVALMQNVMSKMAEETAEILCDNKNIAFTQRVLPDGASELHLLNTSCASDEGITFNLIVNGKKQKHTLLPCEIKSINVIKER
jgi:hypothetical protein